MIVSKYWTIVKIVGGIAHFVTKNKYHSKWPDFHNDDDEVCIECGKVPSEMGCIKVGSRYRIEPEGAAFVIDHTPIVEVPAMDQQQQPTEDEVRIVMSVQLSPAAEGENVGTLNNSTEQGVIADQQRISSDTDRSVEYDEHWQHEQKAAAINDPNKPLDQAQPVGEDSMQIVVAADIKPDKHQQYEQEKPTGEGESVHTWLDATKNQVQQRESGACRSPNKYFKKDFEDTSNEQPQPQPIALA